MEKVNADAIMPKTGNYRTGGGILPHQNRLMAGLGASEKGLLP